MKGRLDALAGDRLDAVFASFSRLLLAWVRTVLSRMRPAFDVHAEAWRAQIERQIGADSSSGGRREQMIEDLRRISSLDDENAAGSHAGQVLGRAAPDVLVDS